MELNKIYKGDCYELIKLIPESEKDKYIIVTDPPFNVGYHYEGFDDKTSEDEYFNKLKELFNGFPFVIIHYPESIYKLAIKIGKAPVRVVSWVYNSNTPKQHRDIAFFGVKPNFNQVTQPYKNLNDKRIKDRINRGIVGCSLYDWWNINQVKNVSVDKYDHPCIMPLEVMKNIIGILPKDKTIIDPFAGSGTTLLACKELGYKYIGFELIKKYYKIAIDRLNGVYANGQISLFANFKELEK